MDRSQLAQLPHPIAYAWWQVLLAHDDRDRLARLLDCVEALPRAVALLLLPDYLSGPPAEAVERLLPRLERPSAGHWLGLLRELARSLFERGDAFVPEAADWAFRGARPSGPLKLCDALVARRNRIVHDAGAPSGPDLAAAVEGLRGDLEAVLESLNWLGGYRLFRVLDGEPSRAGGWSGHWHVLAGSAFESEPHTATWGVPLLRDALYLTRLSCDRFLEVSPLTCVGLDSRTRRETFFMLSRIPQLERLVLLGPDPACVREILVPLGPDLVSAREWWDRRSEVRAVLVNTPAHSPFAAERVAISAALPQALPAAGPPRSTLPAELDRYIGREAEIEEVARLFGQDERMVTILGGGGLGKTRLALQVARRQEPRFPGGVYFCDLTATHDGPSVLEVLGLATWVPLPPGAQMSTVLAGFARSLEARSASLLVLDNAEQVVQPVAEICEGLLLGASTLRVLVTSRVLLRAAGERAFELSPLRHADGVSLFIERAQAVRPGFRVGEREQPVVEDIVRRLEGIPLAIELAASRVRVMNTQALLRQLERRFEVLRSGRRTRVARHATLHAMLDWSWNLLEPAQQSLLGQLSVFRGNFDIEAIEAVTALPAECEDWTGDVLQGLCDASLVQSLEGTYTLMFSMLETVREYAAEQLDDGGGRDAVERRHRDHFLTVAEDLAERLRTPDALQAREEASAARGNLEAALQAVLHSDPGLAPRVALVAGTALADSGPFEDHLALLDRAAPGADQAPAADQARFHLARGTTLRRLGRREEALACLARADESCEGVEEPLRWSLQSHIRGARAIAVRSAGALQQAEEALDEATELARRAPDPWALGAALSDRAVLYYMQGRLELCLGGLEEALEQSRLAGDRVSEGNILNNLGTLLLDRGELDRARSILQQALAVTERTGNLRAGGAARANLGQALRWQGDLAAAEGVLREAAESLARAGDRHGSVVSGCRQADCLAALGDPTRAMAQVRTLRGGVLEDRDLALVDMVEGRLLADLGQVEAGGEALGRAVSGFEALNDLPQLCEALVLRSRLALLTGDLDAFEQDRQRAQAHAGAIEDKGLDAELRQLEVLAALGSGADGSLREPVRLALEAAEHVPDLQVRVRALALSAALQVGEGAVGEEAAIWDHIDSLMAGSTDLRLRAVARAWRSPEGDRVAGGDVGSVDERLAEWVRGIRAG